jgi:hypothetical protein
MLMIRDGHKAELKIKHERELLRQQQQEEEELHHSSHIRLIRRPINKKVWNSCT